MYKIMPAATCNISNNSMVWDALIAGGVVDCKGFLASVCVSAYIWYLSTPS
jgi:hypothetical protein